MFMTVFTLYKGDIFPGYHILAMGWLSPIDLNFAWYANVFFIFAFLMLQFRKKATVSSILAGILALDTIRLSGIMVTSIGADRSAIYGYGYGAVLWFLAISIMIAAAGLRNQEERSKSSNKKTKYDGLLIIGITSFSMILGTSVYFSINDRLKANSNEKERLEGIAFKRYPVCQESDIKSKNALISSISHLEIVSELKGIGRHMFWDSPLFFLSHGQPIVRVKNIDYYWSQNKGVNKVVAKITSGAPEVQLKVKSSSTDIKMEFKLPKKPSFSYSWKIEEGTHRTCPEMKNFRYPQQLALDTLQLSKVSLHEIDTKNPNQPTRVSPEFMHSVPENMYTGCQSAELLPDLIKSNPESGELGKPLLFRETINFYPEIRSVYSNVFCNQEAAYVTHIPQGPIDEGMYVMKISLDDTRIDWNIFVPFTTQQVFMRVGSLLEVGNSLWVTIHGRSSSPLDDIAGLRIPLNKYINEEDTPSINL